MKTCPLVVILLVLPLLLPASATAFYNPNTGRWLNRDPIGDEGFERLSSSEVLSTIRFIPGTQIDQSSVRSHRLSRRGSDGSISDTPKARLRYHKTLLIKAQLTVNSYSFVHNAGTANTDSLGLQPCSVCSDSDAAELAIAMGVQYANQTRRDGRERGGVLCCSECTRKVYAGNVVVAPESNPGNLPIINSKCKPGDKEIGDWHTHPDESRQLGTPGQHSWDWDVESDRCQRFGCSYHSFMTDINDNTTDLDCDRHETKIDGGNL